jgi:hypothetical protein
LGRGLVAQQLDGLAQGVLQVLGDGEGVAVSVLVQCIQQTRALLRNEALAVQQHGRGLEGGVVAPPEDLVPVEAQGPVSVPLEAVDQQQPAVGEQQDPARRPVQGEDAPGDDLVPGLFQDAGVGRRVAVKLPLVRREGQGIAALALDVQGADGGKLRRLAFGACQRQHRDLDTAVEPPVPGAPADLQRREELLEKAALQLDPFRAAALAVPLFARREIVAGQEAQAVVRCAVLLVLPRAGLPLLQRPADVAAEDLG